ncbi:hypothetical protein [Enterocloster hominis (ex Hitch et al. 2024)]
MTESNFQTRPRNQRSVQSYGWMGHGCPQSQMLPGPL